MPTRTRKVKVGDPFIKTSQRLSKLGQQQARIYEQVVLKRLDDFLDAAYLETLYLIMNEQGESTRA